VLQRLQHMGQLLGRSLAADALRSCPALSALVGASAREFFSAPAVGDPVLHVPSVREAVLRSRRIPPTLARESVFAQYAADCGLHEALHSFMQGLAGAALPPNPYPLLCAHLRSASLRYVYVSAWSCRCDNHLASM
jgi:hypothetical protein